MALACAMHRCCTMTKHSFSDFYNNLYISKYIEYPLSTDTLQGAVDYLLRKAGNLVVVEAKGADIERGFAQLTAKLVAVAQVFTRDQMMRHGAITTGDLWYFARLQREEHIIYRD